MRLPPEAILAPFTGESIAAVAWNLQEIAAIRISSARKKSKKAAQAKRQQERSKTILAEGGSASAQVSRTKIQRISRLIVYLLLGLISVFLLSIACAGLSMAVASSVFVLLINPNGSFATSLAMLAVILAAYFFSFKYSERFAHGFIDGVLGIQHWKPSGHYLVKLARQSWKLANGLLIPLVILAIIAVPSFIDLGPSAVVEAARNSVATAAKECAVKEAKGEAKPSFSVSQLKAYKITPQTGDCRGDKNGLITAVSENKEKYPDFAVSLSPYSKSCSHNGPNEELHGCSARVNGTW